MQFEKCYDLGDVYGQYLWVSFHGLIKLIRLEAFNIAHNLKALGHSSKHRVLIVQPT